jgi:hypothetical protein
VRVDAFVEEDGDKGVLDGLLEPPLLGILPVKRGTRAWTSDVSCGVSKKTKLL